MKKKFAIPTFNRELTAHFGHCQEFAVVHVENNQITHQEFLDPPVHQPGAYPKFLADAGVNVIIAGGMGQKARQLFAMNNIEVCVGVSQGSPKELVEQYLENQLQTGQNLCDH